MEPDPKPEPPEPGHFPGVRIETDGGLYLEPEAEPVYFPGVKERTRTEPKAYKIFPVPHPCLGLKYLCGSALAVTTSKRRFCSRKKFWLKRLRFRLRPSISG